MSVGFRKKYGSIRSTFRNQIVDMKLIHPFFHGPGDNEGAKVDEGSSSAVDESVEEALIDAQTESPKKESSPEPPQHPGSTSSNDHVAVEETPSKDGQEEVTAVTSSSSPIDSFVEVAKEAVEDVTFGGTADSEALTGELQSSHAESTTAHQVH